MKIFNRLSYLIGLLIIATTVYSQSIFPIAPNSTIASGNDDDVLRTWLEEVGVVPSGTLLYRRSTDGASASAFHAKVDNQGAALVLFKANNGNVFGGFTTASFNSIAGYVASDDAFLFNLTTDRKGDIVVAQNSIYNNPNYGPTFGGGHDIYINSTMDGGYFRPNSYNAVDGSGRITPTQIQALTGINTSTTGNYNFGSGFITEIEVYKIEFNTSAPIIQGQDITVELDENGQASIAVADIDNGTTDPDGAVTLTIDVNTFNCDNLGGNSSEVTPNFTGSVTQNVYSVGAGYIPSVDEWWYPQWSGQTVYRFDQDRNFLGTFNSGQDQMMQVWADLESEDYYAAHWSRRIATRRNGSTTVWSRSFSNEVAGITTDNAFAYVLLHNSSIIAVLDKETGDFIRNINLPGRYLSVGGMVHANGKLYISAYTYGWSQINNTYGAMHIVDIASESYESSFASGLGTIYGLAFDGETVWISDTGSSSRGFKISEGNAYGSSGSGNNAVRLTATDPLGNTRSEVFSVTVQDNIAPTIALNGDETTNVIIGDTFNDPGANAEDNCSAEVEITGTVDTNTLGSYTLTYKAIDGSGNESGTVTRTVNLVVADPTPPNVIVNETVIAQLNENGQATILVEDVDNGTTDNSGGTLTYELNQTTFDCDDLVNTNSALNFNGSSAAFGSIPYNASLTLNSFTVEAWVKTTRSTSFDRVLTKAVGGGQNYSLAVHNGKAHIRFDRVGGGQNFAESSFNVNDGQWHHLAGVHDTDANTIKIYVDGNLVNTRSTNGDPITSSQTLDIGRFSSSFNQNFLGDIDDIRVWNDVRTDQEISENHNKNLSGSESGLVAFLNMNEGTGTVASNLAITSDASLASGVSRVDGPTALDNAGVVPVTLTATDPSGNSATATTTVSVVDSVLPSVNLNGAAIINLNENDAFTETATAADNCSATLEITGTVDTSTAGVYVLTYKAVDASGNESELVTRTVNVLDVTPPSIVCAEDVSVNTDQGSATAQVQVTAPACEECGYTANTGTIAWPLRPYNNSTGSGSSAFSSTQDYVFNGPFPTATSGAVLTIILSGDINNTTSEYVDLRTEDGTLLDSRINSPDGNINRNYTIDASTFNRWAADGNITFTIVGPPLNRTNVNGGSGSMNLELATPVTLVNDFNGTADASGVYPLGNTTVTWTATDAAGNQSSCTQTITVVDAEQPVLSVQDVIVSTDENTCDALVSVFGASAADNSGTAALSFDLAEGTTFNLGTTLVTATATDAAGNAASATFNVIVEDNTKPLVITQNLVISLDASGNANISANQIDNGSTDNCSIQSLSLDLTSFGCNDLGDNTVTLTVTDASGNSEIGTALVTVNDVTAPIVITKDITVALDANGNASILPSQVDNGSSDNCEIESLLFGVSGDNGGQRTVQVNSGTRSGRSLTGITYTYNGEVKTLTPSNAISSGLVLSTLTAGSGDANRFWDHSATSITEQRALGVLGDFDLGTAFQDCADPAGVKHDVMFDTPITPGAGPEIFIVHGGLTQNIQILDTDGNVALTIASSAGSSNVVIGGSNFATRFNGFFLRNKVNFSAQLQGTHGDRQDRVLALDINASEVPEIGGIRFGGGSCNYTYEILGFQPELGTTNQLDFDCADLGEHVVTLQATDGSGNVSSETATVTIVDEIAPSVVGKPISVTLTASGTVSITADQITDSNSDNCGPVVMSASQTVFGAQDALNSPVTVQLTGTDPSGNATRVDVEVTVIDPVPVVLTQNITVSLDANGAAVISPDQIDNGSSSVVGLSGLALDISSFDCSNLGASVTVTLTATSTLGSTASGTATVTVVDDTNPTAITKNAVVDLVNGSASITAAQINNGSFDNCGITSMILSREFFSCEDVGDQVVTLTVTDAFGNRHTANAVVTVRDVTAPFLNVINRTFGLDNNGQLTIEPRTVYNSSNDDCGGPVTVTIDKSSFDCTNLGENIITVTSTDESGNQNIKQAILTIVDAAEPEVNVKDVFTVFLDESGQASIDFSDIDTGTRDNCGLDRVEMSRTAFNCDDIGSVLVTTRAFDVNGNMDVNAGQTIIIVEDTIATTVLTQDIVVDLDENGNAAITPEMIDAGTYDNCSFVLSLSKTNFDCSNVGENTVRLIATSNSGFSGAVAEATAKVTVRDVTAPVAIAQPLTVQLDAAGSGFITAAQVDNGSADVCGIASLSLDNTSFTCENVGANTVTLTVTDNNGNVSTAEATITVEDNVSPVAIASDLTVALKGNGKVSITADMIDDGSYDACGIASTTIDVSDFDCSNVGVDNMVTLTVVDVNGNSSTSVAKVTVQDVTAPRIRPENITVSLDASGAFNLDPNNILETRDSRRSERQAVSAVTRAQKQVNKAKADKAKANARLTQKRRNEAVQQSLFNLVAAQVEALGVSVSNAEQALVEAEATGNRQLIRSATRTLNATKRRLVSTNRRLTSENARLRNRRAQTSAAEKQLTQASGMLQQREAFLSNAIRNQENLEAITYLGFTSDACGVATIEVSQYNFDCSNVGDNQLTLTVTDIHGNVRTDEVILTIVDDVAPTVIAKDITVALDENGEYTITASDIDGGSFDNCTFDLTIDNNAFNCTTLGANIVNLTATDASGNITRLPATVTVIDNAAPTILAQPITVELDENGSASILAAQVDGGTYDNCAVSSVTIDMGSFNCDNLGENIVTITATDVNGNVASAPVVVTVIDVIAPIVGVQDISVDLDANGNGTINPEDVLILSEDDIRSGEDCTVSAAESHAVWLSKYVPSNGKKVEDDNDRSASASWKASSKKKKKDDDDDDDDDDRKLKAKDARFVFDAAGGSIYRDLDNGIAKVSGTIISNTDPSDLWTVSLNLANASSWSEWSAKGRSYKDEKGLAGNNYRDWTYFEMAEGSKLIGAGRNAGEVISLTHAPSSYRYGFQLGEAANGKNANFGMSGWFFYTNRAGKQVQGDFNLDITDCEQRPTPEVTSDNCSIASTSLSTSNFSCNDLGENTVQVTVTDQSGNSTSADVVVNVNDRIAPVAVAQDITVSLGADGTVVVDPSLLDGGSTDNASCELTFSLDRDTFDCKDITSDSHSKGKGKGHNYDDDDDDNDPGKGKAYGHKKGRGHQVMLTVTDASGNSSSTFAYIKIVDDVAPVIDQGPLTLVVYKETVRRGRRTYTTQKNAYLTWYDMAGLVNDNCGVYKVDFDKYKFGVADAGINYVMVTAEDKSGNVTTSPVAVNVVDITALGAYVDICYKGKALRVKRKYVQHYLRKGASLGSCDVLARTIEQSTVPVNASTSSDLLSRPELSLSSSPNPTASETRISFSSDVAGPARVAVMSTNGVQLAKVFDGDLKAQEEVTVSYQAGNLPSGIYIVRLVTAGDVKSIKLVVRK